MANETAPNLLQALGAKSLRGPVAGLTNAVTGAVTDFAGVGSAAAAPFAGYCTDQRGQALTYAPYNMKPDQIGQMQSDAVKDAAGSALARVGLVRGGQALATLFNPLLGSVIGGANSLFRWTDPQRQQQMACDLYGNRVNDILAMPLSNPNLDWRIKAFMP